MKKTITRRMTLATLSSLALMGAGSTLVQAQTAYPSQPIKFIVPYPAGGTTDVLARMAKALGVDMETIMQGDSPTDQREMALINSFRTMPEESRHTLLATARAFAQMPVVAQKKRSNGA